MNLTDLTLKNATPPHNKKSIKLYDGNGLYLFVNKSGKYWRYDYQLKGCGRKTLSIGKYPDIPLAGRKGKSGEYTKGARDLLVEYKAMIRQGIDPSLVKQDETRRNIEEAKRKKMEESLDKQTFEVVAREWFELKKHEWVDKHSKKQIGRLERYVFPLIGGTPINQLSKPEVNAPIKMAAKTGVNDTARRLYYMVKDIFGYAIDHDYVDAIPMSSRVSSLVPKVTSKHMPAILEEPKIGELLRSILNYKGTYVVRMALQILPYVSLRAGEFRQAKWTEFDLNNGSWTIPAKHRKLKKHKKEDETNVHIVPLSRQAVALLRELKQFTGKGNHVFPSIRGDERPMSENTINTALHAMGYKDEMVGHGFRTIFSTQMNEKNYNLDAIERQLSHQCRDKVRDAYNRAGYMGERFEMMQVYADYLDDLRECK